MNLDYWVIGSSGDRVIERFSDRVIEPPGGRGVGKTCRPISTPGQAENPNLGPPAPKPTQNTKSLKPSHLQSSSGPSKAKKSFRISKAQSHQDGVSGVGSRESAPGSKRSAVGRGQSAVDIGRWAATADCLLPTADCRLPIPVPTSIRRQATYTVAPGSGTHCCVPEPA
jgi:hypothetical protein